jgi:hypothetical protein
MSSTPTVSVREWTDVVRRARLGKTTKYIALMMATYADFRNGERVYPGVATIAVAAEVDYKTVQKAISVLLNVGLIELAKRRSGQPGSHDEYRLILGENLLEAVAVPSPAEATLAIQRVREGYHRRGRTGRAVGSTDGSVRGAGEPVRADNEEDVQPTGDPERGAVHPTPRRSYTPPHGALTPIDQPTTTTSHSDEDLRTAVTHTCATGPPQDPDPPPMPDRCEHGLASRLRKDGKPSCAICRRESAKPSAKVVPFRPRSQPA